MTFEPSSSPQVENIEKKEQEIKDLDKKVKDMERTNNEQKQRLDEVVAEVNGTSFLLLVIGVVANEVFDATRIRRPQVVERHQAREES